MLARPLATELQAMADRLKVLFVEADGEFVAVGERLSHAVGVFSSLSQTFETLPRVFSDPRLVDAADCLANVADEVIRMSGSLDEEKAALSRLLELNRIAEARIAQFQRTVGSIKLLALNAQIVAAGIDVKGEDFSVFSKDIMGLAQRSEAAMAAARSTCKTLGGLLRCATETQAKFEKSRRGELALVAQQLQASLQAIDAHHAQASSATEAIGQRTQQIGVAIAAVVMNLQIGDITRQRVEHIVETIECLSGGLASAPTAISTISDRLARTDWADELSDEEKRIVARRVCEVQLAQLAHATGEFDAQTARIEASLIELADDAAAIVRIGGEAFGADAAEGGSFLDDLEHKLGRTEAAINECLAARAAVDGNIEAVAESLRGLLQQVDSIRSVELDMRLAGLNTTLKCGRCGTQARALAAVAQELRGRAREIATDVTAIAATLAEIASVAERFEAAARTETALRIATLGQEMKQALSAFQQSGTRLGDALSTLNRDGHAVSEALHETAGHFTVGVNVGDVLKAVHRELAATVAELARTLPAAGAPSPRADDCIRRVMHVQYTMASERDIHHSVIACHSRSPTPASSTVPIGSCAPEASALTGVDPLDGILF